MTFAGRQVVQPKVVDANVLVRGMEDMLRRVIGEDIELVAAAEDLPGPRVAGRPEVEVKFVDGEALVGDTLGYDPQRPGSFPVPGRSLE
jgi:hypothetical protein